MSAIELVNPRAESVRRAQALQVRPSIISAGPRLASAGHPSLRGLMLEERAGSGDETCPRAGLLTTNLRRVSLLAQVNTTGAVGLANVVKSNLGASHPLWGVACASQS
jgi:hypothetical protein